MKCISNDKENTLTVNPFYSFFFKWPLCYHFILMGHNVTVVMRTVFKLMEYNDEEDL